MFGSIERNCRDSRFTIPFWPTRDLEHWINWRAETEEFIGGERLIKGAEVLLVSMTGTVL
jgi:hypothetical protein